jgi:predicted GNAT family acetyltransferase
VSVAVSIRPDKHRYEIVADGQLVGFAAYRVLDPDRWAFTHTEIKPEYEHRGLGTALVAEAMADAQRRGISVLPQCPFVRAYLADHPELTVVPDRERARFGL